MRVGKPYLAAVVRAILFGGAAVLLYTRDWWHIDEALLFLSVCGLFTALTDLWIFRTYAWR